MDPFLCGIPTAYYLLVDLTSSGFYHLYGTTLGTKLPA